MELRWSAAELQGMVLHQIIPIQACVSRYLLKADHRTISCYDDAGSCIHVQSLLWTVGFLRRQCAFVLSLYFPCLLRWCECLKPGIVLLLLRCLLTGIATNGIMLGKLGACGQHKY